MIAPEVGGKNRDQVEEGRLPAPFGPMIAHNSPFATLSETSRTATQVSEPLGDVVDLRERSCLAPLNEAKQAAREKQHDEDEQQSDERHPVDGDARQVILQHHEHGGAEQRAQKLRMPPITAIMTKSPDWL